MSPNHSETLGFLWRQKRLESSCANTEIHLVVFYPQRRKVGPGGGKIRLSSILSSLFVWTLTIVNTEAELRCCEINCRTIIETWWESYQAEQDDESPVGTAGHDGAQAGAGGWEANRISNDPSVWHPLPLLHPELSLPSPSLHGGSHAAHLPPDDVP